MMKIEDIKSKQGKIYLFIPLLLCLFFPFSASAQIYSKDSASLFISENTLVSQNQKVVSETHVYVVKGTIITNLQQSYDIQIAYIKNPSSKNQITSSKKSKAKQRILYSVKKETNTKKYFYSKNENQNQTFFTKFQTSIIASFSNGNKFIVHLTRDFFGSNIPVHDKYFVRTFNNNIILKTASDFSFFIRPPPAT